MSETELFLLSGPRSGYTELSRTRSGRAFRKQILKFGQYAHPNIPGAKLTVDSDMADRLIDNFNADVCDIVQVPVVDGKNEHVEDPFRNLGEVIDLQKTAEGIDAIVDARRPEYADQLGKTLIGASAMMHMNYTDTRTGEKVGPTLLHVAVTNRPYMTNLEGFEEIIAASADTLGDEEPVLLSAAETEETIMPELEDMLQTLKNEHGIDVAALQAQAGQNGQELVAAFSNVLKDAGANLPDPEEGSDITVRDVAEAVVEVSEGSVALSNRVKELEGELEAAENEKLEKEIDRLSKDGFIPPAKKESMLELARTNRELFDSILPDQPILKLSESGYTVHEETRDEDMEKDIDRLVQLANVSTGVKASS